MKVASLGAALSKRPFRPIEVRIDGEIVPVRHPEQVLFAAGKTTLIIVDPADHIHILDTDQLRTVRLLSRRAAATGGTKPPVS